MFKFGKKRDEETEKDTAEKTPLAAAAPAAGNLEISADERAEFEEFRRQKKLLEMRRLLRRLISG